MDRALQAGSAAFANDAQAPDLGAGPPADPAAFSGNLALNRPALQSSVSHWSSSVRAEDAARTSNNGDLAAEFGCHTAEEEQPWWQVDLGRDVVIRQVRLYNRLHCAFRLRYFSLFASPDGKRWQRFYKRTDVQTFGQQADDVLVLNFDGLVVARYIRLRLDVRETLHFREFEVFGRQATSEELRQLAILDDPVRRQLALIDGREGFVTQIGEYSVFVDEVGYGTKVVVSLKEGKYEAEERQFTEKAVRPSDRVLEVGTAIGVVSMVAAERTSPEQVRSFDGNPYIVADARRNFAFNRMEGIKATVGILKNRKHISASEKTLKFTVMRDFWASRIGVFPANAGVVEVVDVPIFCLEDEIAAHRANVLIIDIEGGEVELLDGADLSAIRLIIMETHYWSAGTEATDAMMRRLIIDGFNLNLSLSRWGVVLLSRELGAKSAPAPAAAAPARRDGFSRRLRALFRSGAA